VVEVFAHGGQSWDYIVRDSGEIIFFIVTGNLLFAEIFPFCCAETLFTWDMKTDLCALLAQAIADIRPAITTEERRTFHRLW
jgi:hypothetical protein